MFDVRDRLRVELLDLHGRGEPAPEPHRHPGPEGEQRRDRARRHRDRRLLQRRRPFRADVVHAGGEHDERTDAAPQLQLVAPADHRKRLRRRRRTGVLVADQPAERTRRRPRQRQAAAEGKRHPEHGRDRRAQPAPPAQHRRAEEHAQRLVVRGADRRRLHLDHRPRRLRRGLRRLAVREIAGDVQIDVTQQLHGAHGQHGRIVAARRRRNADQPMQLVSVGQGGDHADDGEAVLTGERDRGGRRGRVAARRPDAARTGERAVAQIRGVQLGTDAHPRLDQDAIVRGWVDDGHLGHRRHRHRRG